MKTPMRGEETADQNATGEPPVLAVVAGGLLSLSRLALL